MRPNACVYYGVREQSAVTSVDFVRKSGRIVGLRFGDYSNLPLGAPQRVVIGGEPLLAGPFLEMRTYPVPDEPEERVFLWSIDPKTIAGRLIDDHGGDLSRRSRYVDDWLLDRQGAIVARSLVDFDKQAFVIEERIGGGWKPVLTRQIVAKDHTFAPALIGLGRHDGSIVILDAAPDPDPAGAIYHYYALSPDGGLSGPLEPDDAARDRPVFEPATNRVAGFVRTGAEESYALADPDLQALYQRALDAAPGQHVEIVSTADDPRRMVLHAEGREDPGSYYFVDFSTGASKALGEDYAQIPSAWLAEQMPVAYRAADGLEIEALLTVPPRPEPRRLPLVVLPHDGPQSHDRLGFDWLAQALASRGYLVLQPNYRGSDGYGRALMEAGYDQLGRKMQSDLSDGVRELVAQGLADPKRVCIVGVGMGGYAALTAAAVDPATYRCAASLDGVSDPAAFAAFLKGRQANDEQDQITSLAADVRWPRTFRVDPGSPQILKRYLGADGAAPVPVKLAAGVAMPVLLVSESNIKAIPARQSNAMRDALRASGKAVDFVEVTSFADQPLTTKAARLAALTALLDFLAKQNPAS
jgi:dienelactone hydrolase